MRMYYSLNCKILQEKLLRNSVNDQKVRKEYLYNIFEDLEIQKLLKEDNLDEAKRHVHKLIPNKNNGT